jgi:heme exporter protein D
MDLGPHAAYIWASYAATAVLLGTLALWLALDGRRLQRRLDDIEARGAGRRSGGTAADRPAG